MKTINLNQQTGVSILLYPDNQPHVNIGDVMPGEEVNVICSLTDSAKLLQLLMTSDAIGGLFAIKNNLTIPYLMGARFDRRMKNGDSFDLKVIATMINSCGFKKVFLYDAHSDVSTALIDNSVNNTNYELVSSYEKEDAVLICPDAGAAKKIDKYFDWNQNITAVTYCNKSRNVNNGNLTLKVLEPLDCQNRNCVIVDDLCDGGGTFLLIADQIKPKHLTLIVTHGIFSKGFSELEKRFDEIIVSDSYCHTYNSDKVKTIKLSRW